MAGYYVNNNPQRNGDHEVHQDSCSFLPRDNTYLGNFNSCNAALAEAKKIHAKSNGCAFCSPDCHTG
jgi:hypothetical protein